MKENFIKERHCPLLVSKHLEKIDLLDRINLITEKGTSLKSGRMPLVVTYNRSLLNIKKSINKRLTKALNKFSEITNHST